MNKFSFAFLSMAAVLAVSCDDEKDIITIVDEYNPNNININVNIEKPSTKAPVSLYNEQLFIDGNSLVLSVLEQDLSSQTSMFGQTAGTKGAPVNDSIFKADVKFMLFQYEPSSANPTKLIDSTYVQYKADTAKWIAKKYVMVPDDGTTWKSTFWNYPKYDEITDMHTICGTSDSLLFKYDASKAGNDSALWSQDILFAYDSILSTDSNKEINLVFKHALAAIQFQVGDLGIDKGLVLQSIELTNLYGKGNGAFIPGAATDSAMFLYTNMQNKQSYKQDYDLDVNKYSYGKNFDTDTVLYTRTFFVMPQAISDDAKLVVKFLINGTSTTRTLTKNLKDLYPTFYAAGKLYTYRISGGGVMSVKAEQYDFESSGSMAWKFQNTGEVCSFVRAKVIANWYNGVDNDSIISKPWSKNSEELVYNTTDWYLSTNDGFFYYKYPLMNKDDYTTWLFKEDENYGTTYTGLTIRFHVAVQQVRFADKLTGGANKSYAENAWGAENTSDLETSPRP